MDVESRTQLVDEFGELSRKLAENRHVAARAAVLSKMIAGWFDDAPAEASGVAAGNVYDAHVTARANRRLVIDPAEMLRELGPDTFLRVVTVRLEDFDRLIAPEDRPKYVTEGRTGPRRVDPVLRMVLAQAKQHRRAA